MTLFVVSVSVALLVLCAAIIYLLVILTSGLAAVGIQLRLLREDLAPVLGSLGAAGQNALAVSQAVMGGVRRAERIAEVFSAIGEDLDEGRRSLKGGIGLLGDLLGPWLARFRG